MPYVPPQLWPHGPALRRSLNSPGHGPDHSALGNPAGADVGPEDFHRSLTLHTWVGYSVSISLLKHLNSDQLPGRRDAGTRDDPKLIPPSGFIPKHQLSTPENPVATQSGERKDHFVVGISCREPGVTVLQLMNTNQQQSHRTLRKPQGRQRQDFASFGRAAPQQKWHW